MSVKLNPYLNFKDNTREVMEFYKSIFGGNLTMQTFKDFQASEDPSEGDKIMHSMLEFEDGLTVMASDTSNHMEFHPGHNNFGISLSGDDEPKLRGYYEKLAEGGEVFMPLEKAQWGDMFGMVVDKFGVTWLINISTGSADKLNQETSNS